MFENKFFSQGEKILRWLVFLMFIINEVNMNNACGILTLGRANVIKK
jgi:hypothetical protein